MTLWHLMVAICFSASVGAAASSAQLANAGIAGWVSAILIGSVFGISYAAVMWWSNQVLWRRVERRSVRIQNAYAVLVYLTAIPWWMLSGFLASRASASVLHIIS